MRAVLEGVSKETLKEYFIDEAYYRVGTPFPYLIHPAALVDYNEKKILRELARFGWSKPSGLDANSTNCLLNSLGVSDHFKKYGYNPYVSEIARLVREGYMSRKEGLQKISAKPDPKTIAAVKKRLEKD